MKSYQMYINGEFVNAASGKTREVLNPATEQAFATVPEADASDVDKAVKAARKAFSTWSKTTALERSRLLMRLSQKIQDNAAMLAELEILNNGKAKREAQGDVDDAAACFEFYAGLATKVHGETMQTPANAISYVVREPLGVCGQIIPWNFPILMATWKLAPALAAGNCVILKPSELTPLTALELAKLIHDVGFPAGVVNIVTGDGKTAGEAIVTHPDVDKVAFTGGTVTGAHIMELASKQLKRVTLELGGKSPAIFFNDCNLDLAIDWGLFATFAGTGQVCSAGTRLLVQAGVYDEFMKRYLAKIQNIKVGSGLEDDVTMGPLVSKQHREKVEGYIALGKQEGATLAYGGDRPSHLNTGYFLNPTVFTDVTPNMRIVREEIFGPVAAVMKFSTEEEAIALANDTHYGLAAGIFTQDITRAHHVIRELRAGITWINYYHPTYNEMPWGGYKQSGTGRELGLYGIEAYLETKQININLDTEPVGWY